MTRVSHPRLPDSQIHAGHTIGETALYLLSSGLTVGQVL